MRRLMSLVALWIARAAWWLIRILGKGKGSSLPGMIALKIYPDILGWFASQPRKGVIMVTGTNGKTTTSNMLAQIISSKGNDVISNREGANLVTGVTTAFIRRCNLWGRVKCDYAVLEVDEAAFPVVTSHVRPSLVIVTNFFRDQLDRYGELDTTVKLVARSLTGMSGTKMVLNADDPLVAQLKWKTGLDTIYFGVEPCSEDLAGVGADAREGKFCPFCGSYLQYSAYNYSQLGQFTCTGCDFRRPTPHFGAFQVSRKGDLFRGSVLFRGKIYQLSVTAGGMYNFYNALAALSGAVCTGIEPGVATEVLRRYMPATGRMDRFEFEGKPLVLNLVKNPAGFNQALTALICRERIQDVLIAINDNAADGRDISWLWDVDFEVLEKNQSGFSSFVCTGRRAEEMAVRLKYAGISPEKIFIDKKMDDAIDSVLSGRGEECFLLATYTALWPLEAILGQKAKRVEDNAEGLSSVS